MSHQTRVGEDRSRLAVAPSLDELAADPSKVAGLPPEAARTLTLRLAAVLTALASVPAATGQAVVQPDDRLLTIPEVADRLSVPTAYAYELARRGALPTVRVGPKYVRVPARLLSEWVARQQKELDGAMYQRYSIGRDRQRVSATSSRRPRPDPSGTRQTTRRHADHRGPLGAGGASDIGAGRETGPVPG